VVELSIVVPVYGCQPCLVALNQRLISTLKRLRVTYEILYVDDRSPDGAWPVLLDLADRHPGVRAVRLSRNFGQHAAITAGMARAGGRWIVVMDCDLQDKPESIPDLYKMAHQGFDVVFARRTGRKDSSFRRLGARVYFWLLGLVFGSTVDGEYGTFSIVSRKVADAYLQLKDVDRHYLFILNWLGFEATAIDVAHSSRYEGRSAYTFSRLVTHAVDGVVFQTTKLLRWIVYAGFLIALAGVALAAFFIYSWAVNSAYPGWTSLAVLILLLGGFMILSLGVTGLYVGKIFGQVKARPLYVVDEESPPASLTASRLEDDVPASSVAQ